MSEVAKKWCTRGLLVLVVALSVCLVGCGGGGASEEGKNEVVGTWTLSGIEADGVEMSEEYVEQYLSALGEDTLKVILKDNGEAQIDFVGTSDDSVTYTFENGKGSLKSSDESLDFTLEDGKMKIESSGVYLIFSK